MKVVLFTFFVKIYLIEALAFLPILSVVAVIKCWYYNKYTATAI
jgi:hypothetical protein